MQTQFTKVFFGIVAIICLLNYLGSNSTIIDRGNYDFLWQLNANSNKMGFITDVQLLGFIQLELFLKIHGRT